MRRDARDTIAALTEDARRHDSSLPGEYEELKREYTASRVWSGRAINALMEILNLRKSKNKEIRERATAMMHVLCKEAQETWIADQKMTKETYYRTEGDKTVRLANALGLPPVKSATEVNPMLDLDEMAVRKYAQAYRAQAARRMTDKVWPGSVRRQEQEMRKYVRNAVVEDGIDKLAKPK